MKCEIDGFDHDRPLDEQTKELEEEGGVMEVVIIYKDGTTKTVAKESAWEYENDPDYERTVSLEESSE